MAFTLRVCTLSTFESLEEFYFDLIDDKQTLEVLIYLCAWKIHKIPLLMASLSRTCRLGKCFTRAGWEGTLQVGQQERSLLRWQKNYDQAPNISLASKTKNYLIFSYEIYT